MINLFVQVGLFLTDVHSLHKFQLEIGKSQSFEVLIKMIGEFFKVVPKDYLSVKKILAVINTTYAVAKRKPEKIRLAGIGTLTSAIPGQRSNQLS